jgi:hypothetical protein
MHGNSNIKYIYKFSVVTTFRNVGILTKVIQVTIKYVVKNYL